MVPIPAAVQHPLFIADIPGWRNDEITEGMTFGEDRSYLEGEISEIAARSGNPVARQLPEVLATSFERQFFELSLRNKEVNKEYVRQRLRSGAVDSNAILAQLECFLLRNEGMKSHPTVLELHTRLSPRVSSN